MPLTPCKGDVCKGDVPALGRNAGRPHSSGSHVWRSSSRVNVQLVYSHPGCAYGHVLAHHAPLRNLFQASGRGAPAVQLLVGSQPLVAVDGAERLRDELQDVVGLGLVQAV